MTNRKDKKVANRDSYYLAVNSSVESKSPSNDSSLITSTLDHHAISPHETPSRASRILRRFTSNTIIAQSYANLGYSKRGSNSEQLTDFCKFSDQKIIPFNNKDAPVTKSAGKIGSNQSLNPDIVSCKLETEMVLPIPSYPVYKPLRSYSQMLGNSHLSDMERIFLEAAEYGDKSTMQRCLGPTIEPSVNVNCHNMIGRTAIQIAVDNENLEIVEMLLMHPKIIIGDALLYAIQEGVYRIVEMLVDHHSIKKEMLCTSWSTLTARESESHDFSSDISPVILAAICNKFEILQLLISRGADIEQPHKCSCGCQRCIYIWKKDSLKHSLWRINTYKALASPAWISLTSKDPVLTAFKLSWELRYLASSENEFKEIFNDLSLQCRKYACELLDQCRTIKEVKAILSRDTEMDSDSEQDDEDEDDDEFDEYSNMEDKSEFKETSNGGCGSESTKNTNDNSSEISDKNKESLHTNISEFTCGNAYSSVFHQRNAYKLDRLKVAIKYEQKRFVAHPHTQHLLTVLWYDQLPGWRRYSSTTKVFICTGFVFMLPFLTPIYLINPHGCVGRLLRSPLVKFITHSASFAIFLLLLLIASTEKKLFSNIDQNRYKIRGPAPNGIEYLIMWWVIGFVWSEMKQIWDEGFKTYVRQWWNWLDFIMLSLYITTIVLRVVALCIYQWWYYDSKEVARQDWDANDPTLISEALFSIAHIFSFARIIYLFQMNEHLGPLQISLGNMLIDITKFIFIFLLVITSFACGLHQLFFYYSSGPQNTSEYENQKIYKPSSFSTLLMSYKTLFWALFGVNTFESKVMTQVKNIKGNFTIEKIELGSAKITNIVGEILLLIYHAMAIIVLINMLIAMMSNSFQTIQNQADIEWKFARSKLWVGYFDEGSTLPPPLNTIVSPKSIIKIFKHATKPFNNFFKESRIKQEKKRTSVFSDRSDSHKSIQARKLNRKERKDIIYQSFIRRLVRRYIHLAKKRSRQHGVDEDDLLEIKQDISSLRYELRDDRRSEVIRSNTHMLKLKKDIIQAMSAIHKKNGDVRYFDEKSDPYHNQELARWSETELFPFLRNEFANTNEKIVNLSRRDFDRSKIQIPENNQIAKIKDLSSRINHFVDSDDDLNLLSSSTTLSYGHEKTRILQQSASPKSSEIKNVGLHKSTRFVKSLKPLKLHKYI